MIVPLHPLLRGHHVAISGRGYRFIGGIDRIRGASDVVYLAEDGGTLAVVQEGKLVHLIPYPSEEGGKVIREFNVMLHRDGYLDYVDAATGEQVSRPVDELTDADLHCIEPWIREAAVER